MKSPLAWFPVINPSVGPTPVNCSMYLALSWGRITHGSISYRTRWFVFSETWETTIVL